MGNHIKVDDVARAFAELNRCNFDNRFAAICAILRILKTQGVDHILANQSYRVKKSMFSNFLSRVFSFQVIENPDLEDDVFYATFPKGYSNTIFCNLMNKERVNIFHLISIFIGNEKVDKNILNKDGGRSFFAIPEDTFDLWFSTSKKETIPQLISEKFSKDDLKKKVHKAIKPECSINDFRNFKFSTSKKCNTISGAGELKRGPYFQPLYGSFDILESIIVSGFNLAKKYAPSIRDISENKKNYSPENLIFYGPPGTGKTRAATILAHNILTNSSSRNRDIDPEFLNLQTEPSRVEREAMGINIYVAQFHPSYSYEDFFEGIRPIQIDNGEKQDITYKVVPGTFKVVCDLAKAYLFPRQEKIFLNINLEIRNDESGQKYIWDTSEESILAIYRLQKRKGRIFFGEQEIFETGQSYKQLEVDKSNLPNHSGNFRCSWIYEGDTQEFILFIDELNRGNPAKIFGEGLSLIEKTKRIGGNIQGDSAKIILPYSHENFGVPANLHIICSMNTADKSLATLDQAFKRRFDFIYFPPIFKVVTTEKYKKEFSEENLKAMISHFESLNSALKGVGVSQENFFAQSYLIEVLRYAYLFKRNITNCSEEQSLRLGLEKTWKRSLHNQIREMISEDDFERFAQKFNDIVSNISSKNKPFLTTKKDTIDSIRKYLDDIRAPKNQFPWKESA